MAPPRIAPPPGFDLVPSILGAKSNIIASPTKEVEAIVDGRNQRGRKQSISTLQLSTQTSQRQNRFGLGEGVVIPDSVQPNLLKGDLLRKLRCLPVKLINAALTDYDDSVRGRCIRNPSGFLHGIVKKYHGVAKRSARGVPPIGAALTPAVHTALQKLIENNFCMEKEISETVKRGLGMLSEKDALLAIDELSCQNSRGIKNFESYFMRILNRYMSKENTPEKSNKRRQVSFDCSLVFRTTIQRDTHC